MNGSEDGNVVLSGSDVVELKGLLDRSAAELAVQPVTRADLMEILTTFTPTNNSTHTQSKRLRFKQNNSR